MYVSFYEFCASFCELCDFSWIVRSDAIRGRLCEIAPSRNIRRPVYERQPWHNLWLKLTLKDIVSLKCRDVRWKGPEKRNKPDVVASMAKHPDVVRFHTSAGCNRRTCAVCHFGGNLLPAAVSAPAVAICLKSLTHPLYIACPLYFSRYFQGPQDS